MKIKWTGDNQRSHLYPGIGVPSQNQILDVSDAIGEKYKGFGLCEEVLNKPIKKHSTKGKEV